MRRRQVAAARSAAMETAKLPQRPVAEPEPPTDPGVCPNCGRRFPSGRVPYFHKRSCEGR